MRDHRDQIQVQGPINGDQSDRPLDGPPSSSTSVSTLHDDDDEEEEDEEEDDDEDDDKEDEEDDEDSIVPTVAVVQSIQSIENDFTVDDSMKACVERGSQLIIDLHPFRSSSTSTSSSTSIVSRAVPPGGSDVKGHRSRLLRDLGSVEETWERIVLAEALRMELQRKIEEVVGGSDGGGVGGGDDRGNMDNSGCGGGRGMMRRYVAHVNDVTSA